MLSKKQKTVYLGGAIGGVSVAEATIWRKGARYYLEAAGLQVFDPTEGKDLIAAKKDPGIYDATIDIVEPDLKMIEGSDILLVNMMHRVPYVGTPMEIAIAGQAGKEIFIFTTIQSYWLQHFATKIFSSMQAALTEIVFRHKNC